MPTRGSALWRKQYWKSCKAAKLRVGYFGPQLIKLAVPAEAHEAYDALFDTMAQHDYVVRPKSTGAYNCRQQTNSDVLSAHAYGIAVDVNWDTNPYVRSKLVTDMPKPMVIAIEGIRTVDGIQVWRWGGDWDSRPETRHVFYDAMHWEILATPGELLSGILRPWLDLSPSKLPVLKLNHRGDAVVKLQELLQRGGFPIPGAPTGNFLKLTNQAVRAYQKSRGLKADGIVGPATWTALLNDLPPVGSGELRPSKTRSIAA